MKAKHYNIIVVGGGFAGVSAAISASREGKRVLLIEKYNCLGGAAAYDLVNPFMPYWTRNKDTQEKIYLSRGLFLEIVDRLKQMNAFSENSEQRFNEEILKLVLNRMALESGVELLFQTSVIGAQKDGERISTLTISNVSGLSEVSADYYIDATGDANLSMLCGYDFRLGRESDHLCQPMTLCFRLGGVDMEKYKEIKPQITPLYKKMREEGRITNPREDVLVFYTVAKDVLHFNSTRVVKLDPTNADDVTKAEIMAREQVFELVDFLKSNFDAFRDAVLLSTGMQIGVRESRMICGLYTLTQEDLLSCTKFEDGIAACNYDIDIHSPDGAGTSHYYFPPEAYYTIPYRCLIPQNSKNLLVAGRCVSATHEAQASLRIMPTCSNLGEAAGIAAALACQDGIDVADVCIKSLRQKLREAGALVD